MNKQFMTYANLKIYCAAEKGSHLKVQQRMRVSSTTPSESAIEDGGQQHHTNRKCNRGWGSGAPHQQNVL